MLSLGGNLSSVPCRRFFAQCRSVFSVATSKTYNALITHGRFESGGLACMKLADRLKRATYRVALPATSLLTAVVVPICVAHAQTPAATMTVLTPKPNETLGTNRFNLDVRFKTLTNSPIVTAELWVDGVRWVRRDLDSPRRASVLSFLVDGSTLSAGSHMIVVKVLNAEGNLSSSSVTVVAGSDEATGEAAWGGPDVRFIAPGNGKKVVGSVELLIDAKSRNGQDPYISFYVDDKFKTLKNYPPYSFVWDSTKESNGVHKITASGYLDSTNATTTRTITVYVNNPGGNTVRMKEIPDLSEAHKATPANAVAKPLAIPIPKKVVAPIFAPTGEARITENSPASVVTGEPQGLASFEGNISAARVVSPRLSTPKVPVITSAPKVSVVASAPAVKAPVVKPIIVAKAVTPRAIETPKIVIPEISKTPALEIPTFSREPTTSSARETASVDINTTVAELAQIEIRTPQVSAATPRLSRPSVPVALPVRTVSVALIAKVAAPVVAKTVVKHVVSLSTPRLVLTLVKPAVKPVSLAVVKPVLQVPVAPVKTVMERMSVAAPKAISPRETAKSLQVAFDGTKIAFDVAPRIDAGMPVAPFRQIFEHTGGRVSWSSETKTMRAVNSDREIIIGVGKSSAIVNGETISMGRAASLERGRTIVPLTFVGKALDVNVKYDSVTGRLSITSKN